MAEPAIVVSEETRYRQRACDFSRLCFGVAKRGMDIFLGTAALIVSLPFVLFCAGVVKFSSKGPVVYRQVRVGKGGAFIPHVQAPHDVYGCGIGDGSGVGEGQ